MFESAINRARNDAMNMTTLRRYDSVGSLDRSVSQSQLGATLSDFKRQQLRDILGEVVRSGRHVDVIAAIGSQSEVTKEFLKKALTDRGQLADSDATAVVNSI